VSQLPPGWAFTTLGEIAETRLGKMLSKKARMGNGSRPYLRNKNVQWGRIELDDVLEMDFTEAELERFGVLAGDLLVCEGGEVGRAAIWRGQLEWIGYQKALHRVRPLGEIAPEYLL
jgi:type I restriction enzyme S subunit